MESEIPGLSYYLRVTMVIYLIGLMGSGKSTLGAALASELGYTFHDTDTLIEQRNNLPITGIFSGKGEQYFRTEEAALINELVGEEMVVSCGGGLPFFGNLMDVLLRRGEVIYLHALPETLLERISPNDTTRPLLGISAERKEVLQRQYNERNALYSRANFRVEIRNKTITELISEIRFLVS